MSINTVLVSAMAGLVLLAVACSGGQGSAEERKTFQQRLDELPGAQAQILGGDLKIGDSGSKTLRIEVEVPPDHHGYLDKGDDGYLIPFSFKFAALEAQGARVVEVSRPAGVRDDKWKATVLRGTGEFAFRVEAGPAPPAPGSVTPVSFRFQICNDIIGACYAPKEIEIPLRIARSSGS